MEFLIHDKIQTGKAVLLAIHRIDSQYDNYS